MAEFTYNNTKNTSTSHILFKLNYNYYLQVLLKKDVDLHSRYCFANKLAKELKKLIKICYQNLFYA